MTNYEKIKNMSIDEMADFMLNSSGKIYNWIINTYEEKEGYTVRIKEWLVQEAKPTLSEAERTILENIDKDYKWIVRDENGLVMCYTEKPKKMLNSDWHNPNGRYSTLRAFNHLFQFITWNDSEPYNIAELLKGD